jgi:hypothetical protein
MADELIFNFGVLKGRKMLDVLNANHYPQQDSTKSGLNYLYYEYINNDNITEKSEIKRCFEEYCDNFVIKFGKFAGKTLSEIDRIEKSYITAFLSSSKYPETKEITMYYINKHKMSIASTLSIDEKKNKYNQLEQQINQASIENIEFMLCSMGYEIKKRKFKRCPLDCGDKDKSNYEHAGIFKGNNGTYMIHCYRCGKADNLVNFVRTKKGFSYPQTLEFIASAIGALHSNFPANCGHTNKKSENVITLETRTMPEMTNLDSFGFERGVYPPQLYNRGFSSEDAINMDIYFAGKYCRNKFKGRICFLLRDENKRVVGVQGRNKYTEEEFICYYSKKLNLDKSLSKEILKKQIFEKTSIKYIKYYTEEDFKIGSLLYNAYNLNRNADESFVVEGGFDVCKMTKYGFSNTCGMLGSTLSTGQLYLIYSLYKNLRDKIRIYLFIDNDETGREKFKVNMMNLQSMGFRNIYKMQLNGKVKDACEATREQVKWAYEHAELQPIITEKKKIMLLNLNTNSITSLE